jgi:NAD(P)-dependent dehydrogenase (short-subunit alcohol dehydrogenase family)
MWGGEPRVVTVSSTAHKSGTIHFDDLTGARRYARWPFYAQSKFANVLFGLELDRRLRLSRVPMKSVLAHPGYSATNLQSSGPTGLLNLFLKVGNRFMAQDVEIGGLCQLYAATHPGVEGGQFIGPDGRGEARGYPTLVQPVPAARSRKTARKLWELSEELTGVRYDLSAISDHTPPDWERSGTTLLAR